MQQVGLLLVEFSVGHQGIDQLRRGVAVDGDAVRCRRLPLALESRHIGVGVVGSSEAAVATLLARLRLWGYQPSFLAREEIGPMRRGAGLVLAYRPDARRAATALAGDLRPAPRSVVRTDDAARELVVISGR